MDDVETLEIIGNTEKVIRNDLVKLIEKGAKSTVLFGYVSAIQAIENTQYQLGEDYHDDDSDI